MAFERLLLQAGFSETLSSRCLSQASSYRRGSNNDVRRTVYFFMRGSPIQFKVTAIMLVCWDSGELRAFEPVESEKEEAKSRIYSAVFAQRIIYGANPPANQTGVEFDAHDENDDESRALHDDREER